VPSCCSLPQGRLFKVRHSSHSLKQAHCVEVLHVKLSTQIPEDLVHKQRKVARGKEAGAIRILLAVWPQRVLLSNVKVPISVSSEQKSH